MNDDITYIGTDEPSKDTKETTKDNNFKTVKRNKNLSKFISSTKPNKINKKVMLFILILIALVILKPIDFLKNKLEEKRLYYYNINNSLNFSLEDTNIVDSFFYLTGHNFYKNCRNSMIMPAKGMISYQYDFSHKGIDIVCDTYQDNIYAAAEGYVKYIGYSQDYGNEILIEHNINNTKIYTFYGNLSAILVNNGQYVSQGQVIAHEGGNYIPNSQLYNNQNHHLHFEVRKSEKNNSGLNPNIFIK